MTHPTLPCRLNILRKKNKIEMQQEMQTINHKWDAQNHRKSKPEWGQRYAIGYTAQQSTSWLPPIKLIKSSKIMC